MAGRCTLDALKRVFIHCDHVRTTCKNNNATLHAKFSGHKSKPLVGGLQISLDMTAAFDRVPWPLLETALEKAHDIHVLMHWLEGSPYPRLTKACRTLP